MTLDSLLTKKLRSKHGGTTVDLERIVAELEEERDRVGQAINALKQLNSSANAPTSNGRTSIARGGARLTAAGRTRLSELMKKRWAERKRKAKSS
jgi:hypothetical protein